MRSEVYSTIRLICSGVNELEGSLPAERIARGGVEGFSVMVVEQKPCLNTKLGRKKSRSKYHG